VICRAYLARDRRDEALERILELPDGLRPREFGSEEGSKGRGDLSDAAAYRAFRSQHPEGFFLFSERCLFDISAGHGDVPVWVECSPAGHGLTQGDLECLLVAFMDSGAMFTKDQILSLANKVFMLGC